MGAGADETQRVAPDLADHEPVHFHMRLAVAFPNPPQRVVTISLWQLFLAGVIAYNAGIVATSVRDLASEASGEARERGLYTRDFWSWTQEQAGALRRRDSSAIDWNNLIEEVETLGRSERSAWSSYCANVISHLLKIHHSLKSPDLNHWRKEIEDWRTEMHVKLSENPGMKGELAEMLDSAWRRGRDIAVRKLAEHRSPDNAAHERQLRRGYGSQLPAECPYALEDIAGYDPFDKDAKPGPDAWPAPVAQILNDALGTDYPVRYRASERGAGHSR